MRIQFSPRYSEEIIADFDVAEEPTDEQCKKVEDEIYDAMNEWAQNDEDLDEFDYWEACHDACEKHLKLVDNPVVKTIYL